MGCLRRLWNPWAGKRVNEWVNIDPDTVRIEALRYRTWQSLETLDEMLARLGVVLIDMRQFCDAVDMGRLVSCSTMPIAVADRIQLASGEILHGYLSVPQGMNPMSVRELEMHWRMRNIKRGLGQRYWRFAVASLKT